MNEKCYVVYEDADQDSSIAIIKVFGNSVSAHAFAEQYNASRPKLRHGYLTGYCVEECEYIP